MWGITPFDHASCRIQFKRMRYEDPDSANHRYGSLYYPGVGGGMNWGSVAVDEVNHLMVVNSLHNPSVVRLIPRAETEAGYNYGIGGAQAGNALRCLFVLLPFVSLRSCLKPPYGEIAVVDLASQEVLWRRPLGTTTDMGPLGIPTRLPLPMGMFYTTGSMVTGGG